MRESLGFPPEDGGPGGDAALRRAGGPLIPRRNVVSVESYSASCLGRVAVVFRFDARGARLRFRAQELPVPLLHLSGAVPSWTGVCPMSQASRRHLRLETIDGVTVV